MSLRGLAPADGPGSLNKGEAVGAPKAHARAGGLDVIERVQLGIASAAAVPGALVDRLGSAERWLVVGGVALAGVEVVAVLVHGLAVVLRASGPMDLPSVGRAVDELVARRVTRRRGMPLRACQPWLPVGDVELEVSGAAAREEALGHAAAPAASSAAGRVHIAKRDAV